MTQTATTLEFFLYSDQPTTCPHCGSQTDVFLDLAHTILQTQAHICIDRSCRFEFFVTL